MNVAGVLHAPIVRWTGLCVVFAGLSGVEPARGAAIFLDADTPATGSLLQTQPLVTPLGQISFVGEIRDKDGDPEFDAAGALGNVFDIANSSSTAQMNFAFNVQSVRFIYGGNTGDFGIEARDINGSVVASFFQASTDVGQPAGPITLTGTAPIRSLLWRDTDGVFAPIDNVTITPVPEPGVAAFVAASTIAVVVSLRRRSRRTQA